LCAAKGNTEGRGAGIDILVLGFFLLFKAHKNAGPSFVVRSFALLDRHVFFGAPTGRAASTSQAAGFRWFEIRQVSVFAGDGASLMGLASTVSG
jgi:hypothetical protein